MPRPIQYYFSLMSPWAYLGHAQLGAIAGRNDVEIDYRPVNLMDLVPESGGLPLGKRHPSRQRYRLVEMQRWREMRDVPLVLKPKNWPFDFHLADRVALTAAQSGPQDQAHAFIAMAFRAVWVEECNLADSTVLARLLKDGDYEAGAILERARSPDIAEAYEANKLRALEQDVFGSPTYVLEGEAFWGQDRLEQLESALVSGRAPYTPEAFTTGA